MGREAHGGIYVGNALGPPCSSVLYLLLDLTPRLRMCHVMR